MFMTASDSMTARRQTTGLGLATWQQLTYCSTQRLAGRFMAGPPLPAASVAARLGTTSAAARLGTAFTTVAGPGKGAFATPDCTRAAGTAAG